jgi:2'-5' RNA ligase
MNQNQTKRLFMGFSVNTTAKKSLIELQDTLLHRLNPKALSIAADNFHLTLAFLGPLQTADIPALIHLMDAVPKTEFSLSLDKIAFWPAPKILCLTGASCESLDLLEQNTHKVLSPLLTAVSSAPCHSRPYAPHISLFRKVKSYQAQHSQERGHYDDVISRLGKLTFSPSQLHLYESSSQTKAEQVPKLESPSSQVQYTILHSWPLTNADDS